MSSFQDGLSRGILHLAFHRDRIELCLHIARDADHRQPRFFAELLG